MADLFDSHDEIPLIDSRPAQVSGTKRRIRRASELPEVSSSTSSPSVTKTTAAQQPDRTQPTEARRSKRARDHECHQAALGSQLAASSHTAETDTNKHRLVKHEDTRFTTAAVLSSRAPTGLPALELLAQQLAFVETELVQSAIALFDAKQQLHIKQLVQRSAVFRTLLFAINRIYGLVEWRDFQQMAGSVHHRKRMNNTCTLAKGDLYAAPSLYLQRKRARHDGGVELGLYAGRKLTTKDGLLYDGRRQPADVLASLTKTPTIEYVKQAFSIRTAAVKQFVYEYARAIELKYTCEDGRALARAFRRPSRHQWQLLPGKATSSDEEESRSSDDDDFEDNQPVSVPTQTASVDSTQRVLPFVASDQQVSDVELAITLLRTSLLDIRLELHLTSVKSNHDTIDKFVAGVDSDMQDILRRNSELTAALAALAHIVSHRILAGSGGYLVNRPSKHDLVNCKVAVVGVSNDDDLFSYNWITPTRTIEKDEELIMRFHQS